MLQAIKVGDTRVVANNIRRIVTLTNDKLVKFDDGTVAVGMSGDMPEWFSDIELRVYFSDDPQSYIRFFADEARDFLRQFDALTGIAETDAVAEPVTAQEIRKPVDGWISPEGFPLVIDMLEALSEISFAEFSSGKVRYYAHELHKQLVPIQKDFEAAGNPLTTNAEPVAAAETGTLRDALPFLYTVGLRDFNYLLTDIVNSAAPESAKVEAKKLKLFTDEELEKRKALALKQRESLLKR